MSEFKGCLKELKRLKRHYQKECKQSNLTSESCGYIVGVVDGLDMAISILENKDKYGD